MHYLGYILLFLILHSNVNASELKATENLSSEFIQLSEKVKNIQRTIYKSNGIKRIFITGGSAKTILDHLYLGKPLKMRDLDIAFIANQDIDLAWVQEIAEHLIDNKIGHWTYPNIEKRLRCPEKLPMLPHTEYNAGYGFYLVNDAKEILDISIFEYTEDLSYNGVLNIDCCDDLFFTPVQS